MCLFRLVTSIDTIWNPYREERDRERERKQYRTEQGNRLQKRKRQQSRKGKKKQLNQWSEERMAGAIEE